MEIIGARIWRSVLGGHRSGDTRYSSGPLVPMGGTLGAVAQRAKIQRPQPGVGLRKVFVVAFLPF